MKNKLSDLNDHLFAQMERLSEEGLSPEKIEAEAKRGEAIVGVADQIIRLASLQVEAAKIVSQSKGDPRHYLPTFGAPQRPAIDGPKQ